MKFASTIAAPLAVVMLAGCASARIVVDSSAPAPMRGSAPAPGAAYSSAVIRADVGASAWVSLLFLGAFAAAAEDDYLNWRNGPATRRPPELDADRAIAERDCTRPMEATSANLRCK